jgi:hypothetical protein
MLGVIACSFFLREDSGPLNLLVLVIFAVVAPLSSIFSENWWRYVLQLVAISILLFFITLAINDVLGVSDKMGPAGMAYLWPMLLLPAGLALSGVVRFGIQAVRQARGQRGGAPFISRSVAAGALIVAGLFVAWTAWTALDVILTVREDERGRERAAPINLEGVEGLSGETSVLGNIALVQVWNRTKATWIALEVTYRVDGGPELALRKTLDFPVRPSDSALVSIPVKDVEDGTVSWRVTTVVGWE